MGARYKVLISAYACEPGKGSEPEVGWQWALQMARFHEVTVLTRANNREVIEPELERLKGIQPLPNFVYHDRGPGLLEFKRRCKAHKIYYLLWQRSAREVVQRLHEVHRFDLMHHVTFAAFRYPIAVWGHGAPSIWGPIGGIESIPNGLLPWHHPVSLVHEITRNLHNVLQATPFLVLPRRARATTLILATTNEMQRAFLKLGFNTQVMPTIGLNTDELPWEPKRKREGPLRLLFVGNIITLKGLDLALDALKLSGTNAEFTLVGTGNYQASAHALARKLGLQERVKFAGRLPREQVLKLYRQFDVFVFPSLHDTGGYAVIEAMFNELPVVCLDCGGPAVAVQAGCGTKIPLGPRSKIVRELAEALRFYEQNEAALAEQGKAARAVVLRNYDWDRKGEQMNECYRAAVARMASGTMGGAREKSHVGMGGMTNVLHQVFSLRGVVAALIGLLLIGALGFMSLSHLRTEARQIVADTLPGLSYAGEANASLAQAYNRSLMLLMTDSPEERARLHKEIEDYSKRTTECLEAYQRSIFEPADQILLDNLMAHRQEYFKVRARTLALAENNQRAEALEFFRSDLTAAYQRYKQAGDRLFEHNMRQGQARGHTIMAVCTTTQILVAAVGIFIFIAGFLIGMFK